MMNLMGLAVKPSASPPGATTPPPHPASVLAAGTSQAATSTTDAASPASSKTSTASAATLRSTSSNASTASTDSAATVSEEFARLLEHGGRGPRGAHCGSDAQPAEPAEADSSDVAVPAAETAQSDDASSIATGDNSAALLQSLLASLGIAQMPPGETSVRGAQVGKTAAPAVAGKPPIGSDSTTAAFDAMAVGRGDGAPTLPPVGKASSAATSDVPADLAKAILAAATGEGGAKSLEGFSAVFDLPDTLAAPTLQAPSAAAPATAAPTPPTAPAGATLLPSMTLDDVHQAEPFGERIQMMLDNGLNEARLEITPRHIGTIEIRIRIDKDGADVQLMSPNSEARQAMETSLPKLRELFAQEGLNLQQSQVGSQMGQWSQQQARTAHTATMARGEPGGHESSEDEAPSIRPLAVRVRLVDAWA